MAVAPVADEIDDHVLLEPVAELEREAHDAHRGFGVVAVHVEDRCLHHLGDVGRVHARAPEVGRGGEAELVVDDHVDGAADLVARHLGEVERLGDHTLARRTRRRRAGAPGAPCGVSSSPRFVADRARHALDDRAHRFEVARVRGEGERDLVSARGVVLADRAEVVLHVARTLRARRVELALELAEDLGVRLADDVGEHVEPTPVGRAEHHVGHAGVGGLLQSASSMGTRVSAPSRLNRFWPRYLVCRKRSNASAAFSRSRMRCFSSG